jgi:hypothetical protein
MKIRFIIFLSEYSNFNKTRDLIATLPDLHNRLTEELKDEEKLKKANVAGIT